MSTNADAGRETDITLAKSGLFLDSALRPGSWNEYIGQESVKNNLRILLGAASARGQSPEHILFYGPPGLGKTTLAHLVARETGAQMKVTSGPAIERVGDLASILSNLAAGDVLFIDEVHRLNKMVEEVLYPAMESGTLHIIIGKGPGARTIELELQPFTLVAATTRVALLSSPLRSRFSGGVFRLNFYTNDEIVQILKRSAAILGIEVNKQAYHEIATRSRFTPRIANHFLKRVRDYAEVNKTGITEKSARDALNLLEVDESGLYPIDRAIIETIIVNHGGGPVGVGTVATALQEEPATIEEVSEPYLIQIGLLERTPRGRVVTRRGYEHLGYEYQKLLDA